MDVDQILCFFCKDEIGKGSRQLQEQGKNTILKSFIERNDGLVTKENIRETLYLHNTCYKSYTRKENITKSLACKSDTEQSCSRAPRRPFGYRTHCLICVEELHFDSSKRHPDRPSAFSEVEVVNKDKKSLVQKNLLKPCEGRADKKKHLN